MAGSALSSAMKAAAKSTSVLSSAGRAAKAAGSVREPKAPAVIKIKPSRVGSLHAALGVPQGAKIPAGRVAAAAKSSDPVLRKKAVFAQNAAGWGS